MALPYFLTSNKELSLLQTSWQAQINPVLANPFVQGILIEDVALVNGSTVINHLLGRKQQGWVLVDISGAATIYRSQPFNSLTLTLVSSAAVTVNLYCF